MKPLTKLAICFSALIVTAHVQSSEPLKIVGYLVDELWVCDNQEQCADIPKSALPDPTRTPLLVKKQNSQDGLVMTEIEGEEKWFEEIEVELNKKPDVTGKCSDSNVISQKSDKKVYASYGLGEGC